jgi:hypothetical protein
MSTAVDEAFCAVDENKLDARCSCYNVIERDCETEPDIPGCKESLEYVNSVMDTIPNTENNMQRTVAYGQLMQRLYCTNQVCAGEDKYKPPVLDELKEFTPCAFNLNMCVQNTEIDTALGTSVDSECKINENWMGVDPWELDFAEDEVEDIARLKEEHKDNITLKKLEIEEAAKQREAEQQKNNIIMYAAIGLFILIVLFLMR